MRRAARRLVRAAAFLLLRVSGRLDRWAKAVVIPTFTNQELDSLSVLEWEAFGDTGGPVVGSELFAWEKEFFATWIRRGDALLVVGAGTGRDVLPLLEAGHRITALDITPRALEALRERASTRGLVVDTVCASIAEAALPKSGYDVVLFSWLAFSYLRTEEDRRVALDRCLASLRPGGRVLISYAPAESNVLAPKADAPTFLARWLGGVQFARGDFYSVSGTAGSPNVHFTHFFHREDIEVLARGSGCNVLEHRQPTSAVALVALEPAG